MATEDSSSNPLLGGNYAKEMNLMKEAHGTLLKKIDAECKISCGRRG
jgi:hypothetical protein